MHVSHVEGTEDRVLLAVRWLHGAGKVRPFLDPYVPHCSWDLGTSLQLLGFILEVLVPPFFQKNTAEPSTGLHTFEGWQGLKTMSTNPFYLINNPQVSIYHVHGALGGNKHLGVMALPFRQFL